MQGLSLPLHQLIQRRPILRDCFALIFHLGVEKESQQQTCLPCDIQTQANDH